MVVKTALALVPLLLLAVGFPSAAEKKSSGSAQDEQAGEERFWFENWDDAVFSAKQEHKPMVVNIYSPACGPCRFMDENVFPSPEIHERLARDWVFVKMNAFDRERTASYDNKTMTYAELTLYFRVHGFPTCLFFDRAGNPNQRVIGSMEKEDFALILDYMRDEVYASGMTFRDYQKKKAKPGK